MFIVLLLIAYLFPNPLIEIEADTLVFESQNLYVELIMDTGEIIEIKDLTMDATIKYGHSDINKVFNENDIYGIDRE